jgi:hypothetical protein
VSELSEEEKIEQEARQAMRRFLRKLAAVLGMAFFVGLVFHATLLSVVSRGMTRPALFTPIAVYLAFGALLVRRRRWVLALFCAAGLILHLTVIQDSAKTLSMKRETRTKEALFALRAAVSEFEKREGRPPRSLEELPGAAPSPLICGRGRPKVLSVSPARRGNTGAWVYEKDSGRVSVDCAANESSGKRWSEL